MFTELPLPQSLDGQSEETRRQIEELRERVDAELRWLKDYAYHLYSFIDHTKLPLKI